MKRIKKHQHTLVDDLVAFVRSFVVLISLSITAKRKNRDWNKWNTNLWSGRAQLYGLNKSTKKCRACGDALYVMNILCVTLQSGLVFKVVVFLNIGNVCFYLFAVKIMTFIKYLINVNCKILCNKKVRSELSGFLPLPCSFFLTSIALSSSYSYAVCLF